MGRTVRLDAQGVKHISALGACLHKAETDSFAISVVTIAKVGFLEVVQDVACCLSKTNRVNQPH